MSVRDSYRIASIKTETPADVWNYWSALNETDFLERRICDERNPNGESIAHMMKVFWDSMFYVHEYDSDVIVSEFTLCNFTGNAAQIHCSSLPGIGFKRAVQLARDVTDYLTADIFSSLFGLTPVTNRAACLYVLRAGFRKIGILPEGILDRGKIVDAMITIKGGE